jgi:heme oxygenase
MRAFTHEQHAEAERSGIVAAILAGKVSVAGYALYLRNLLPAYQCLEQMLVGSPTLGPLADLAAPALCRAPSIRADLDAMIGPQWHRDVPLLPVAKRYASRIGQAGSGDGQLLIAHVYTRYLGDLSGGPILRRRLERCFGPGFPLRFTEFHAIGDKSAFVAAFRTALDAAGSQLSDEPAMLREVQAAFRLNIDLSLEVDAAVPPAEKKVSS